MHITGRTDNVTIYDRPEGGVPIYVAAGGPQMAKYAGRVGDLADAEHAAAGRHHLEHVERAVHRLHAGGIRIRAAGHEEDLRV